MPNPNPTWFRVNVNFNVNPPECDQINMPAKGPDGKHPFDGIQFTSNRTTCMFTGIAVQADQPNEWPAATISADGQAMTQEDLYLDGSTTNHTYLITYTDSGVAKSFDPGIRNQDQSGQGFRGT
jgi:hypothetical protein